MTSTLKQTEWLRPHIVSECIQGCSCLVKLLSWVADILYFPGAGTAEETRAGHGRSRRSAQTQGHSHCGSSGPSGLLLHTVHLLFTFAGAIFTLRKSQGSPWQERFPKISVRIHTKRHRISAKPDAVACNSSGLFCHNRLQNLQFG